MWFYHLGVKGVALGILGSAFVLANYPRPTHTITPVLRHAQLSVLSTSRQTGLPQNGRPSAIPRLDCRDTVRCKLEPKWHRHERLEACSCACLDRCPSELIKGATDLQYLFTGSVQANYTLVPFELQALYNTDANIFQHAH